MLWRRLCVAILGAGSGAWGQCSFSLSPPSASFTSAGGNGLISVTASAGSCARTAVSNSAWITISFGTPGTGSGTVGYTVQPNNTANSRSGSITIANQNFSVTQAGANCAFTLDPAAASVPGAGGSGSFSVLTTCAWTASTSAAWVTVTGSGTGNGTVSFSASANTGASSRTAAISVGNQSFTLSQPGVCAFSLSPSSASFAAAGGTGTIAVTASATSCDRAASADVSWITLTLGQTGTGNGTVGYTVQTNTTSLVRSGTITIGGSTFAISQGPAACTASITPLSATVPAAGGGGSFTVNSNCSWTAASLNTDWITLSGVTGGDGAGVVSFQASSNNTGSPRNGTITAAGLNFGIFQPGSACDVTLTPQSASHGAGAETGTIEVAAPGGCAWSAVSTAPWVAIGSSRSGAGEGVVIYSVAANGTSQTRTAAITIGNRIFSVTQTAQACTLSLSADRASFAASGGTGLVDVSSTCGWNASSSAGWVVITSGQSGASTGAVGFTVMPQSGSGVRTAVLTIGGQPLTITQSGAGCSLSLTPESGVAPARGGNGTVQVNGNSACSWTPQANDDWLKVSSWSSVSGSGVIHFTAAANTSREERAGTISAGGRTFRVVQNPLELRIASVVNAASFSAGPVAPGEIVTIFGSGFGPDSPVGPALTEDRRAITALAGGTRVLFDGRPAPMIYSSLGQLSAVVPYAVEGRTAAQIQVEYLGILSPPATIPVIASSPAIFTTDASGRGQAAVLNQDARVNSAANPAQRNTIISIFATGEGAVDPAGADGRLTVAPFPRPKLPVTVRIAGVDAPVLYGGGAPGLVAGVTQINARIPAGIQPGPAVPVVIRIGDAESPAGVTIAIR